MQPKTIAKIVMVVIFLAYGAFLVGSIIHAIRFGDSHVDTFGLGEFQKTPYPQSVV